LKTPFILFRHKGNGAVLSRCSQPAVGWFGWRDEVDEELVEHIVLACAFKQSASSNGTQNPPVPASASSSAADQCQHGNNHGTGDGLASMCSSPFSLVQRPPAPKVAHYCSYVL